MAVQGLSANQTLQFQQDRNQYGTNLLRDKATNVYNQQLANLSHGRDRSAFDTLWNRRRTELPTQYLQRGVFNSGIYHGGLQDYATERTRGLSDLLLKHQLAQSGMVLKDHAYEDTYADQLAANYARQFGTQADIAAQLRGVL